MSRVHTTAAATAYRRLRFNVGTLSHCAHCTGSHDRYPCPVYPWCPHCILLYYIPLWGVQKTRLLRVVPTIPATIPALGFWVKHSVRDAKRFLMKVFFFLVKPATHVRRGGPTFSSLRLTQIFFLSEFIAMTSTYFLFKFEWYRQVRLG